MHIIKFIASMPVGLILLALIGITSAVGSSLWPDSFFQTWAFRLLLLLLFINITFCTLNTCARFLRSPAKTSRNWRILFRSISLLLLHASIIFILIGAVLYSCLGHSAQVSILEGDTVELNKVIPLQNPLALKLNKFSLEFNKDGSPAQYYSDLEVLAAGKTAHTKTISVNYPLVYKEVKAYQHNYGYLTAVLVRDGDEPPETVLVQDGDVIQFINSQRSVKIFKYIADFDPQLELESKSMEALNPRMVYSVYDDTELLGIGAAAFAEPINIDTNVFIELEQVRPYTVLMVKTDPGLPLATAGGLLLMLGVCLVLFGPAASKKEV